jgi:hypothetical protein
MKKIFMLFVAAFAVLACDPTHEDISNAGHITVEELIAKSSVTVDKAASGQNGNVITCKTSAPVNAKWTLGGKDIVGNYAWKKMKLGEQKVVLTALCPDGTVLTTDFTINCQEITDPLQKFYIYGEDPAAQPPFKPVAWNAACMRFSDNEGKFVDINGNEGFLPYLSDDVYWGLKTLIFDISECTPDANVKIMTGWWSPVFFEDYNLSEALGGQANGLWELQLTEDIAKACARGNGGEGKDLDLMFKSGGCKINAVYYEE